MPSWFTSSLKRNHHEQQQQQQQQHQQQQLYEHQQTPPPPSLKARKLKEQAWQEVIQQQTTPNRLVNKPHLSIQYHQQPQPNQHNSHTSISSSVSPSWSQHHQHSQSQTHSNNPQSDEVEVLTQSLALRLQELATANHDGLLDDDEYRILRKGLFDQINASNQQPVLFERPSNLPISPLLHSTSFREPEYNPQHHIPNHCHSPGPKSITTNDRRSQRDAPTLKSARSTRSTSSFLQMIFRKSSRQAEMNGTEMIGENMSENRLQMTPSRAGSVHSAMQSDSGQSSLMTNPSAFGDGTGMRMSSNGQLSWSMRLSSTAPGDFSSPNSRQNESIYDSSPLPRRAPSQHISASPSPRTINDHQQTPSQQHQLLQTHLSASSQDYRQIEWSSTEIKQEIADLERECAKLLETFDEMEKNLLAKYRTVPRSGPGGPVTKLEELDELLVLNQQNLASPTLTGSSTTTLREQSLLPDDPLPRRQSSLRPTSFLAPLINPRSFKPKARSIYREMRPASNALLDRQLPSTSSTNDPSLPRTNPPTPGLLFHPEPINALRSDPNQESELQVELDFILNSRLKVASKYQDRLVYLRAKLKGALIRELST